MDTLSKRSRCYPSKCLANFAGFKAHSLDRDVYKLLRRNVPLASVDFSVSETSQRLPAKEVSFCLRKFAFVQGVYFVLCCN